MPEQLSLSQLQALIRQGIDRAHPLPYWVAAEISELKVNYSGHCYIELVEKGGDNHIPRARASAVIWRSSYGMIAPYFESATGQPLAKGLRVLTRVTVTYHELYGLSLQISDIDPNYTLGDMQRQRQETIERLRREGVWDMNRELTIPEPIQRVAVISSAGAAGYQDFMREIESGPYRFEVVLFDAFMQGAGAEESIIAALEQAGEVADDFDALVLIRGGGATSDLGAFDSYRLCCHLAQFPLPLVTGIGHDKDQSVADLVAAVALKTPTAVAVYLKERAADFDARLDGLRDELAAWAGGLIDSEKQRLQNNAFALRMTATGMVHGMQLRLATLEGEVRSTAAARLQRESGRLDRMHGRLAPAAGYRLAAAASRLDQLPALLARCTREFIAARAKELRWMEELNAGQDPRRIMQRGFAWVRRDGRTVASAALLQPGDPLSVQFFDGTVETEVKHTKPRE